MTDSIKVISDVSQQENIVTELITKNFNWIVEKNLSYKKVIKLVTGTLDKMQVRMKEKIIKEVSEDSYELALANLSLLNSTKELYKASSAWQEEVYSKLLESHENNNSSFVLPTSRNTDSVEYYSSSSKATQEQKRWAVLQAVHLEVNNKQRNNILNRAVLLMAEHGWPISTKVALRNALAGLLTSNTPSVEYVNPEKAKYRGIKLTTHGQHVLQSLTYQLKP